jgi:hypothetical protein
MTIIQVIHTPVLKFITRFSFESSVKENKTFSLNCLFICVINAKTLVLDDDMTWRGVSLSLYFYLQIIGSVTFKFARRRPVTGNRKRGPGNTRNPMLLSPWAQIPSHLTGGKVSYEVGWKHIVDRVLGFFQSSELGPPTPSPAGECAPHLWFRGKGHTGLRERGRGVPIQTRGQTLFICK